MNLDKRLRRSNFLPTSLKNLLLQKQRDGYISPPLHAPKEGTRNSVKRIGIVLLFVVFVLYLSGFVLPGFGGPKNQKVVIILAANLGGGVLDVKRSGDWEMEKISIRNKKDYANRHGYELVVKDMSLKRKYAHEWRESWEKVDTIRDVMHQYPNHEWFWWLDLYTFIMEPTRSLDTQIFNRLNRITYRNLSAPHVINPLGMQNLPHVDFSESMDMLVSQDCSGFNLGSFLMRNSDFTRRVLDMWWDPIFYEQKHMEWEHNEQDAFEHMYANQAYIRSHIGFLPQRTINAFPTGACQGFEDRKDIFYNRRARDFIVNMAGCMWGRNCLEEMTHFRELSERLNRFRWWKFWTWF